MKFVLMGNKKDLESEREVNKEEAEKFAEKRGMIFFESSAEDNINIKSTF